MTDCHVFRDLVEVANRGLDFGMSCKGQALVQIGEKVSRQDQQLALPIFESRYFLYTADMPLSDWTYFQIRTLPHDLITQICHCLGI